MRERLTTLMCALGTLCILYFLIFAPKPTGHEQFSIPTSEDRGEHGLLGLKRWLIQSGVPTKTLRKRYDTLLNNGDLTRQKNLLIIALPQRFEARESERKALIEWLEQGNYALILAPANKIAQAAKQTPQNNYRERYLLNGANSVDKLLDAFSYEFSFSNPDDQFSDDEEDQTTPTKKGAQTFVPTTNLAFFNGINKIEIDTYAMQWPVKLEAKCDCQSAVTLLRHSTLNYPILWKIIVGNGGAWISSEADLFGNAALSRKDNRKLLAHIVSQALAGHGAVIFDDMHQGLSDLYDPRAFFKDKRLHNTLWFILALWICYLIGFGGRFGTVTKKTVSPTGIDLAHAVAGLLARRVPQATIAKELYKHFFHDIRPPDTMISDTPSWAQIEKDERLPQGILVKLRFYYERVAQNKNINLIKLTNTIQKARKYLA